MWKLSNCEVGIGGSEVEDGSPSFSHLTTSVSTLNSRKKVRIHGKVSEVGHVDPASVPRKQRSAISKRRGQSASPPFPRSKKRVPLPFDSIQVHSVNSLDDRRKSKQSLMHSSLTKDEEEVAEALYALAKADPISQPIVHGRDNTMFEDKSNMNVASTSYSEVASKEKDETKFSIPSNSSGVASLAARSEEQVEKTEKTEPSIQPGSTRDPFSVKDERIEEKCEGNAAILSKFSGPSSQNLTRNCSSKHSNSDASTIHPAREPQTLCLFGSNQMDVPVHEEQSMKETSENDTVSFLPRSRSASHGQFAMSFSNKVPVCPNSNTSITRQKPAGNCDKLPRINLGTVRSWKKCATHIYVSHLIQMYQNKERTRSSSLFQSQPGANVVTSMHGLLPVLQAQRRTVCEFPSLSTGEETTNPRWRAPYLHPEVPCHSIAPFSISHVSGIQNILKNLSSVSMKQLQVPQYVGNLYYPPHINLHGSSEKNRSVQQQQQQYMWQVLPAAQHGPSVGTQMWQNEQLYSSPSLRLATPGSSVSSGVSSAAGLRSQPHQLHDGHCNMLIRL